MKNKRYLAIDLGASSGRLILGNLNEYEIIHRFDTKKNLSDNGIFWDIEHIFNEICLGIGKLNTAKNIISIGVDSWGADYCLLDENDKLVSAPYCYRDNRTQEVFNKTNDEIGKKRLYELTGTQIIQFNTLYQMKADQSDHRSYYNAIKSLLFIPDYINFLLCGHKYNEMTQASTSGLLDPFTRRWNSRLFYDLKLPYSVMQKIKKSGEILGCIKEQYWNTKDYRPEIIMVGSHDTASAVAAVPAINDEDYIFISSGTWSLVGIEIEVPLINDFTYMENFTNEITIDGKVRLIKNIIGLWLLQELRKEYKSTGISLSWNDFLKAAKETKTKFANLDVNDPVFFAPFTKKNSIINRITHWYKIRHQNVPESIGEISKVIMIGLSNAYFEVIKKLELHLCKKYKYIYIIGGGSQNKYLCQLTSNITAKIVVSGPVEATALGNIAVQAITSGEIENINKARKIIADNMKIDFFYPEFKK